MRQILVVVAAAVLGGVAALVAGTQTGLVDASTETVVIPGSPAVPADGQAVGATAKPLAGNEFDPARIYAERSAGVVTIYSFFDEASSTDAEHAAQGSGFVVSERGTILTSAHVITNAGNGNEVKGANRVYVAFPDGDRVEGEVVGWDVFDDVGVIRVDPEDHALQPVPLGDSSRVVVGEPVAAMGSPFGNQDSLAVGVVSATRRSIDSLTSDYAVPGAIQTDAPITHGNSGGPLFDARGRVIGINAQIRSTSGQAEGVGFAVPINAARRSLDELLRNGRVAYAYVGVTAETLTPTLARHLGLRPVRGALLAQVREDSPGEKAGLRGGSREESFNGQPVSRGGDLVVAIGGRPVQSADDLVRIVAERLAPGQTVDFTFVRGNKRRTVPVKLGERRVTSGSDR